MSSFPLHFSKGPGFQFDVLLAYPNSIESSFDIEPQRLSAFE